MRLIIVLLIFVITSSFISAHEPEEVSKQEDSREIYAATSTNDFRLVSPYHLYMNDHKLAAFAFTAVWIGLFYGIYQLILLILARSL